MLKPDALQREKVGSIIAKVEERGYRLCALKLLTPSRDLVVSACVHPPPSIGPSLEPLWHLL